MFQQLERLTDAVPTIGLQLGFEGSNYVTLDVAAC